MFYDSLLIIAMWMVTTALVIWLITDGEPITGVLLYQIGLYLEVFFFYLIFWRAKGQSLGMQVWKIRATNDDGTNLSYLQCAGRFVMATISLLCFGLGFFWLYFNRERLTWQDMFSKSRIVFQPARRIK